MSPPTPVAPQPPKLVHTAHDLRESIRAARAAGRLIGLVPTMGALHEGHLSLVRASQAECGFTVVTIFVNPTQFAPHEDFDKYPRTLQADLDALASCHADLVFAPRREEVYPAGCSTFVEPPLVGQRWEGECRPGHFRGVTTVVLKLFNLAQADVAFFRAQGLPAGGGHPADGARPECAHRNPRLPHDPRAGWACHEFAKPLSK